MSSDFEPTGTPRQPAYPPPSPTAMAGTNVCAVISLVLAFVFAPAGLVLGIVALRQIHRTGEGGRGLALAGVIVSVLGMVSTVLLYLLIVGGVLLQTS